MENANCSPTTPVGRESAWAETLRAKLDGKTKPVGSLGRLEDLACRLGCILGTDTPVLRQPAALVFAADHGVVAEGVSAYPAEVTRQMVVNFARGGAAINVVCRQHGIAIEVVDAGLAGAWTEAPRGVRVHPAGPGTANFAIGLAMTEAQLEHCLETGAAIAREAIDGGSNVLILGEMGIGNTTSTAALAAWLTGASAQECVGRGTGVDDAGLTRKARVVAAALERHRPQTAKDALERVGGFEIAMMAGAAVEAAKERVVLLADGFVSTTALGVAARLAPGVSDRLVVGHCSAEPFHRQLCAHLGQMPLLDLDMRLGEGSGAALAYPLLVSATAILREMASFDEAGVSGRGEG